MNNLHHREPGEEIDELPYKRSMRRGPSSIAHQQKSSTQSSISSRSLTAKSLGSSSDENPVTGAHHALNSRKIGDRCPTSENTRNLLISRRIIDLFNVGDVSGIQKIIEDAVTMDCDICILPLKQHLIGRAALIDAWESMLEAFPDGVFRVSDTTINDKGELTTRFIFSGARQFNIVLGSNSENENENESGAEAGEIITSISENPRYPKNPKNEKSRVLNDVSHVNSDVCENTGSTYVEPANNDSDSRNHDGIIKEQHKSDISEHLISSKNDNDRGILLCSKVIKKPRRFVPSCPHPLLSKSNAGSICVDYSSPLIRSSDLLVDDATVKVYEGVIVMHTNEVYQISRVDYHWKATDN